ncbi:MAG: glucose-6-phosphate isomerase [Gammaproteobacteria bacterium]
MIAGPETSEWRALEAHAARLRARHTRDLVDQDPDRFERCSREAAGFLLDFSRQHIDADALTALAALADAVHLRDRIEAMWRGDLVNATEGRAVLHVALRQPPGANIGGAEIARAVADERERMLTFAEAVRTGKIVGSSARRFERIVNIGIGGSDLGPAMVVEALRPFTRGAPNVVFISNVDGCALADTLAESDPKTTLFIIASKTFTTLETLTNARTARAWLAGKLGDAAVREHFAAVSVNHRAMDEFGVHPEYRFQMWDWVGGRYSIWSSIGVSLAIAIGRERFIEVLAGGHLIDEHFRTTAWPDNLPVLMALLGVWNVNFQKLPTLAVLPYDDRLKRFPAYLQQLEMESNGKSVTLGGRRVAQETAPVIWGEPGNNAQHSFFQLIHQGTPRAALDFLLPATSSCGNQPQQDLAIANCLAQAEAFMTGQTADEVRATARDEALVWHKVHDGARPSSILLFAALEPRTLGRLIALYEHKVFAQSVVWGINAFDQWGVELGKKLAERLAPAVRDPRSAGKDTPASIRKLLEYVAKWK